METKWCQSCMLTEIELVWNRWERNITNFIPKGQQCGSTKEKKTLKIPGGRYEQRPVSETMTLVGKDPSNFSSALKKRRKFFLNWLLNIFWVRKWDLLYISISGFQIMSAGSLQRMSWFQFQVSLYRLYFYALQSSSFKYIYLWLYSLCNVHVFLSFKCIYSYFNCVHYEPLVVPDIGHTIILTGVPSQIYIFPFLRVFFLVFTRVSAFVSHDATYVTQPNIGCQYLVLFVLEWHNWERSFVWWLVSIVFTNDTKSTICWRASPNVKLMGDFSSTTGLDFQTFSKKKTVIWILRLKHISKAKTIPLKAVVREQ